MSGIYNGFPTGYLTNTDIVRLNTYFTTAVKTLTLSVNDESIRFDNGKLLLSIDGNMGTLYTITLPLLVSKGWPCTFYICSYFQDDWFTGGVDSIAREMYDAGMDMQCHSKSHTQEDTLTEDELHAEMQHVNNSFTSAGIPTPEHHAYPFGSYNGQAMGVISQYRKTGRAYQASASYYTYYNNQDKFILPGSQVDEGYISTEDQRTAIKEALYKCQQQKGFMSLMWHQQSEDGKVNLVEIIEYAENIGMDVVDMSELLPLLTEDYLVAFRCVNQLGDPVVEATITIGDNELTTSADGYAVIILEDDTYNFSIARDLFDLYEDSFTVDGSNVLVEAEMNQNEFPIWGEEFEEGLIAHIFEEGEEGYVAGEQRGILAAKTDQSTAVQWGCQGTAIGTLSTAIGEGKNNTDEIVAFHNGWQSPWEDDELNGIGQVCNVNNDGNVSAKICDDLVVETYSDWHLPSKDELQKFRTNLYLNGYGNFAARNYWSSSEVNNDKAWVLNFPSDAMQFVNKYWKNPYTRAARYFARKIVVYEATGDITNISPDTVVWNHVEFYTPYALTEFTFNDDGTGMTATWNEGTESWDIVETV
jgi:peptidoglycan/xylan/chitin deacetylase (PgdA/CDA1 family)